MRRTVRRARAARSVFGGVLLGASLVAHGAAAQSPPAAPEKLAVGDWQISPSVEVRVRGEYRRDPPDHGGLDFFGRSSPYVRDAWGVMERSRVGLGAERGAVRAQVTLQDARVLGSSATSTPFGAARGPGKLEPYEAFLEARSSGARPHFVRIGRQAVVWGEGRLIGKADFAPAGRSLDAARGHLALGNFQLEALAAMLEAPGAVGAAFGDTSGPSTSGVQLYGVTVEWALDPLLSLQAFGLARISRSRGAELDGSKFAAARLAGERMTTALRVSGEAKGWSYGVEGAYQFGAASSIALGGADISAWAAAAHVQKLFDQLVFMPTFRVAGSYASGDDRKGAYKQFDPLLPDPQRFHGQMDLFAWSNVLDVSARTQIAPWTDTSFALEYRYARLAEARGEWIGGYLTAIGSAVVPPVAVTAPTAPAGVVDPELGHELDFVFAYRPWMPLELRAGWSGLLLGDGAKGLMTAHARGRRDDPTGVLSPADIAHYAYLQATLSMP